MNTHPHDHSEDKPQSIRVGQDLISNLNSYCNTQFGQEQGSQNAERQPRWIKLYIIPVSFQNVDSIFRLELRLKAVLFAKKTMDVASESNVSARQARGDNSFV